MINRLHDWLDELGIFFRGTLADAIGKYAPAARERPGLETYELAPPADGVWRACFPAPLSFSVSGDSPRHAPLEEVWAEVSGTGANAAFGAALTYLTTRFGPPENSDSMYIGNHMSRSWDFGHGAIGLSCHIHETPPPEPARWKSGFRKPAKPQKSIDPDYAAITIHTGWFPELAADAIQPDALIFAAPLHESLYFDGLPGEFMHLAALDDPQRLAPGMHFVERSGDLVVTEPAREGRRVFLMPRTRMREVRYELLHPAMNNSGIENYCIVFEREGLTVTSEVRAMFAFGGYHEGRLEVPAQQLAGALKLPFVRLESDNY